MATQIKTLALIALAAVAGCLASRPLHAGNCHHFFHKQAVVVQQVVAQPYVLYQAGQDIQAEALAEKVARLVEQKLTLRQTVSPQQQVAPNAFARCVSCHSGPTPAAGLVLDGITPITCHAYWRWGEMAGLGKNVPPKMQGLLNAMTPEQKGAINEAMLKLGFEPTPPPGPPVADDPFAEPSREGELK